VNWAVCQLVTIMNPAKRLNRSRCGLDCAQGISYYMGSKFPRRERALLGTCADPLPIEKYEVIGSIGCASSSRVCPHTKVMCGGGDAACRHRYCSNLLLSIFVGRGVGTFRQNSQNITLTKLLKTTLSISTQCCTTTKTTEHSSWVALTRVQ